MRARAFLALLLLSSAGILPAQETGAVRESAEVSLVEVPVRVLGRDGQPVRGLTAEAFTLEDDGRRQAIVGFDAIDLADKSAGRISGPPNPAARRRFLILFDFSFSQPRAIVAARRAARDFVLSGMGEHDLAAVATYSVERGVRLLVTFSSDRAQLARAIETLGLETRAETGDPLAFAYEQAASVTTPGIPSARPSGGRNDATGLIESLQSLSILHQMRDDEYARGRVRQLFGSFRELSQALDAVEGRKDVIYLSEGFRGRFLIGTSDTEDERQYLIQGEVWKVDSDKRYGSTPLRNELGEVGRLFRRSDCVIHAVDIAGIRAEGEREEGVSVGLREPENALYEIAESTGGEVFKNANDFGEELGRIVRETSLVYVLAFRPDRAGTDGRFHELKVKVSTPGARVLARAGYYDRKGFRQLSPLERRLVAADVVANEIPLEQIPARVLAVPFAGGEGVATVSVLLEVPGAALLDGDRGEKLTVEMYAYAVDGQGRLADFFVRTISADLSKNRSKLAEGGLRYYGVLQLAAGTYRLRTLVRNATTGRMGFSVTPVEVPAFSAREPYLLPPLFLEAGGSWVSIQGGGRPDPSVVSNPFTELPIQGLVPAALARVAKGDASRLCLVAYHFDGGERNELKLGSQILAEDGRPMESVKLAVLGSTAPGPDGKRMMLVSFEPPAGLSPGRYGLRVFLQGSTGGATRQATAPFLVP